MSLTELNAISPIDGRYRAKTKIFSAFFSEEALIKYRLEVEIEYFIALCELKLPELIDFDPSNFKKLRNLYENFSTDYAVEIKQIEKITNHDVACLCPIFVSLSYMRFVVLLPFLCVTFVSGLRPG